MADAACDILFLAGRLGGRDEIQSLRSLVDRLRRLGHESRVICLSAGPDHGLPGLFEAPGLARRWRLPWAARGLGLDGETGRPRVLHVLGAEMADAGVEVAERWRLPYLLTIDEFPRRDARVRISRAWCRGLVATNPELAASLTREFGIPGRLIRTIARGIAEPARPARAVATGRVPVVGAAGPMVAGSGFATFLNAARRVVDSGLDAEFLLAGQGEDEAELRRRADRLRIADRLTFADDLAVGLTFWDVLDVYCQTSSVPTAGRSLALALAHGVPSIASDVEGLRALVGGGPRIPPGDPAALATAIVELLSDRDRARAVGEAGRDAVLPDHHPDREAGRLSALYRELADPHPITPAAVAAPAEGAGLLGIGGGPDPTSRSLPDL